MVLFTGIDIDSEDLVALLKRDLKFNEICRQLLGLSIVRQEAAQRAIQITENEIQSKSDAIRRELRLESAEKTMEWLGEQHLSAAEWEESLKDRLLMNKLADAMFKEAAKSYFDQNRLDYEQVLLYRIVVQNIHVAQELIYQIEEKEINFFEAAHRYDIDPARRAYCGYLGQVSRWSLEPDIAAGVFGAKPQEVVGPFPVSEGYAIFWVDRFILPELTDEIYQEIRDRKFQAWLDAEIQRLQP